MATEYSIWSLTAVSLYFIWAGGILLFFRVVIAFLPSTRVPAKLVSILKRWAPGIEFAAWIMLLVTGCSHFLETLPVVSAIFAVLLTILLAGFGWYYLRDFVAGIVLKSSGILKEGDTYSAGAISGRIRSIGHQGVVIENGDNDLMFIPYSRLYQFNLTRSRRKESRIRYTFQLDIPRAQNNLDLRKAIERAAYMAPNTALPEEPEIEILGEKEDLLHIKITMYLIDPKRHQDTLDFLRKQLGSV